MPVNLSDCHGKLVSSLANGCGTVAIKDYVNKEKTVSVYAVDYAGNRSEMVFFNSPDPNRETQPTQAPTKPPTSKPTEPAETEPGPTETTAPRESNPLTPDGDGTILDEASGEDDKQFYTITTAAGNVFYLILDGQRDSQNVYFLNKVTEDDLMALAEDSNGGISVIPTPEVCTCVDKCEAGNVYTPCPVCLKDLRGCLGKEKPTQETQPPTEPEKEEPKSGGGGMALLAVVAMVVLAGIGYYVKIVLPKQNAEDKDDDYGEDYDPGEAYGEPIDPYGEPEYLSEGDDDQDGG